MFYCFFRVKVEQKGLVKQDVGTDAYNGRVGDGGQHQIAISENVQAYTLPIEKTDYDTNSDNNEYFGVVHTLPTAYAEIGSRLNKVIMQNIHSNGYSGSRSYNTLPLTEITYSDINDVVTVNIDKSALTLDMNSSPANIYINSVGYIKSGSHITSPLTELTYSDVNAVSSVNIDLVKNTLDIGTSAGSIYMDNQKGPATENIIHHSVHVVEIPSLNKSSLFINDTLCSTMLNSSNIDMGFICWSNITYTSFGHSVGSDPIIFGLDVRLGYIFLLQFLK